MSSNLARVDRSPFVPRVNTERGARFALSDDEFLRWYRSLTDEDAQAFLMLGGDQLLARFVCAFDFLKTEDGKLGHASVIEAYAIAADIDPATPECRIRAQRAFEHGSVIDLLDRIRYRSMRQATERIIVAQTNLIEMTIKEASTPDVSMKDRVQAISAVNKWINLVAMHDQNARDKRIRAIAKGALDKLKEPEEYDTPQDDELERYTEMLVKKLGKDKAQAILAAMPDTHEQQG